MEFACRVRSVRLARCVSGAGEQVSTFAEAVVREDTLDTGFDGGEERSGRPLVTHIRVRVLGHSTEIEGGQRCARSFATVGI